MATASLDFLKIFLSFIIAAFGIPSLSGVLSVAAASFGYALFWHATIGMRNRRFFIAFIWFAGVQGVQLNWMISTQYMGPGIVAVYLMVIMALGFQFAILTYCIRLPMSWTQILGLSGLWVIMEWMRLFFLTGFPWNPIGLTLAANSYSIQAASLFGIYGLCFWVIFVNLASFKKSLHKIWIILAFIPYGFGFIHQFILERVLPPGKELTVALVQTALRPEQRDLFYAQSMEHIEPLRQWDFILSYLQNLRKDRFDLIVLSEGAVPDGPWQFNYSYRSALAVWAHHFGESSFLNLPPKISPYTENRRVSNAFWMQALSNHFNAEVIAGLDDRIESDVYNAAFHFTPKKTAIEKYQKKILIPMGEYVPLKQWKWLSEFSAETFGIDGSFSSGKEVRIFKGIVPIGVFICLEEAYSQYIREIRQNGALLFVNLTNDVWFPGTRLPWHHFDHGRLRAVENGVCLLRATNTGVTSAIDCFGKPIAILPPSEIQGGALDVTILTRSYSTLYTFLGDTPVICMCGFFTCLLGMGKRFRKKKLL